MDRRGTASVLVLWLAAAVTVLSLAVAEMAHLSRRRTDRRLQEIRALFAVHAAVVDGYINGFSWNDKEEHVNGLTCRLTRTIDSGESQMRLRCRVTGVRFQTDVEIEWAKVGADWHPRAWRERA